MIITVKNKYFVRSRISESKFREIIKYFALNLTASKNEIPVEGDRLK